MVIHPLFLLGLLASIAWAVNEVIRESPVLNRASMTLAWTMTPIAVAVTFLAGWAVLRARERRDGDPPAVVPTPVLGRVTGVLVGLGWPVVVTFVVQLALLGWIFSRDPVTSIVWAELLVGPVFVGLMGALAAAVTRWLPHPSSPMLALFVLAASQVILRPFFPEGRASAEITPSFLAPIAWPLPTPYEVAFRPSVLHFWYLLGLVLVMTSLAVLGRRVIAWALLAAGLVAVALFGPAQLGPIEESQQDAVMARLVGDQAHLTCQTHDGIEYCAMPGYEGWIDDWATAVEPMLAGVPEEAVEGVEVRQYPAFNTWLVTGEISTSGENPWWIQLSHQDLQTRDVVPVGLVLADDSLQFQLVDRVASRLVGCQLGCDEEGSALVAKWLESHDPEVRQDVEQEVREESDHIWVAYCMVAELWARPDSDELVRSNWETLTAADTSYKEAGEILGIEVPEGYDERGRLEGGCP